MAAVHVVGAGLAGLAAAVRLAERGQPVTLYEAAQHAGGRCRSFFDRTLGRVIDNGNHLLVSGNRSALAYLDAIGASERLTGPADASFPFVDLTTRERWTVRPNRGPLPFWVMLPSRRVPGTHVGDYLAAWRLWRADERQTLADCLRTDDVLWRRFWSPLATAVLNTPAETASARLLWAALRESFALGAAGCRPLIARASLAASLVDPGLRFLRQHGTEIAFGQRLRAIGLEDRRASFLDFGQRRIDLQAGDRAILALPPGQVGALLPGTATPQESHAIVNGHFRLPAPVRLPGNAALLGLIGGTAEWLFVRDDLVSLTVSAADSLADETSDIIAARLWADTAVALGLPARPQPPARIVKERRATFAQTPEQAARRAPAATRWPNLFLAGDWTATELPATIEGAIRSGHVAAELALTIR
ncbi:MAG TPA: hydroxysqualene dehydroxylase HpnE [Geminicoccaceae bacterium]|jgi:squalene-associated FAD-dependent desaturase|nr:hydroxysqualene dehydroxylase HpnE [Geminicoccaceae bacterium]